MALKTYYNRRRWFQFGIGTLFVAVTIFAACLGWELSYIRKRELALKAIPGQFLQIDDPTSQDESIYPISEMPTISRWRIWLGDIPVLWLAFPPEVEEVEIDRLQVLFPEADIYRRESSFPFTVPDAWQIRKAILRRSRFSFGSRLPGPPHS